MLNYFLISFLLACFAIVWVEVLTDEGMILYGWFKILNKLPLWLANPLGMCVYCFAGQLSLWAYIVIFWNGYNLFYHILFITLTIFYTLIFNIWKSNT